MAAERSGSGTTGSANGSGQGDDTTATPTRLVTRPAAQQSADPVDDHYDFLDDRDVEFKWRPASGGEQAGEAEGRTAPAWVKRARAEKGRSAMRSGLASVLTLAVIGLVVAAAFLIISGRSGGRKPPPEVAPAASKVPAAPAADAPTSAAQRQANPQTPVQPASPPTADTAPNAPPAPADSSDSANGMDKAVTDPPGGEDGPPDPAQQAQPDPDAAAK